MTEVHGGTFRIGRPDVITSSGASLSQVQSRRVASLDLRHAPMSQVSAVSLVVSLATLDRLLISLLRHAPLMRLRRTSARSARVSGVRVGAKARARVCAGGLA